VLFRSLEVKSFFSLPAARQPQAKQECVS